MIVVDNEVYKVYTVYSESGDMTFIMLNTMDNETENLISTECIGWYYGEPNKDNTLEYIGRLKAAF